MGIGDGGRGGGGGKGADEDATLVSDLLLILVRAFVVIVSMIR